MALFVSMPTYSGSVIPPKSREFCHYDASAQVIDNAIVSRKTRGRKSLRFAFHISTELIICICYLEILTSYDDGKHFLVLGRENQPQHLVSNDCLAVAHVPSLKHTDFFVRISSAMKNVDIIMI
jgi:hypothetical protein